MSRKKLKWNVSCLGDSSGRKCRLNATQGAVIVMACIFVEPLAECSLVHLVGIKMMQVILLQSTRS